MEFKEYFNAVAEKQVTLQNAKNASVMLEVQNAESALADALQSVMTAENAESALATVKERKQAVMKLKTSTEFRGAEQAVLAAEVALAEAEKTLKFALNSASQYDVTLYLVACRGNILNKALSALYADLQGNTSTRGHEQYVQRLKEGIHFALDCLSYGMTLDELNGILK